MDSDVQRPDHSDRQALLLAAQQMTAAEGLIFQRCLQAAANGGQALFESLLNEARAVAEVRVTDYWGTAKAEGMNEGPIQLNRHAPAMAKAFGPALMAVFLQAVSEDDAPGQADSPKAPSLSNLRFDQLELMDNAQVHEGVGFSKVEQAAKIESEHALTELNALMCAVQGLQFVELERNPLRPASYVIALQNVFQQADATDSVKVDWLQLMGVGLGRALCATYVQIAEMLVAEGVSPADYNVIATAPAPLGAMPAAYGEFHRSVSGYGGIRRNPDAGLEEGSAYSGEQQIKLTMDQLRRLVAGDLMVGDADGRPDRGMRQFASGGSLQRDRASPDHDQTLPAALEALQELRQVDHAVARLTTRLTATRSRGFDGAGHAAGHAWPVLDALQLAGLDIDELFDYLSDQAHSASQILGLETVLLMVEEAAANPRLLPPVQAVIRSLVAPLLRLVMVDSRFFNDKAHPARQLLDAIIEKAMEFSDTETPFFAAFIQPLKQVIDELPHVPITDAEPFRLSLAKLNHMWTEKSRNDAIHGESDADASWVGEARMKNLAKKIAHDISNRADAVAVPSPVLEFAVGPWALVIAQGQLSAASGVRVDDMALLADLFWSASPALAGTDPDRLIKLIPSMLTRLRAGLRAINYPKPAIGEFFEILMALHQKALSDKSIAVASPATPLREDLLPPMESPAPSQIVKDWHATNETMSPSFLDHFDFPEHIDAQTTEPVAFSSVGITSVMASVSVSVSVSDLPVDATATHIQIGSWVEMTISGNTMRAQLVWGSPEGTNFMFTTSTGRNQSMTRRSVDALIQRGMIKLLQSRGVPGDAASASALIAQPAGLNNQGM